MNKIWQLSRTKEKSNNLNQNRKDIHQNWAFILYLKNKLRLKRNFVNPIGNSFDKIIANHLSTDKLYYPCWKWSSTNKMDGHMLPFQCTDILGKTSQEERKLSISQINLFKNTQRKY